MFIRNLILIYIFSSILIYCQDSLNFITVPFDQIFERDHKNILINHTLKQIIVEINWVGGEISSIREKMTNDMEKNLLRINDSAQYFLRVNIEKFSTFIKGTVKYHEKTPNSPNHYIEKIIFNINADSCDNNFAICKIVKKAEKEITSIITCYKQPVVAIEPLVSEGLAKPSSIEMQHIKKEPQKQIDFVPDIGGSLPLPIKVAFSIFELSYATSIYNGLISDKYEINQSEKWKVYASAGLFSMIPFFRIYEIAGGTELIFYVALATGILTTAIFTWDFLEKDGLDLFGLIKRKPISGDIAAPPPLPSMSKIFELKFHF